jgi:hypothetical protein
VALRPWLSPEYAFVGTGVRTGSCYLTWRYPGRQDEIATDELETCYIDDQIRVCNHPILPSKAKGLPTGVPRSIGLEVMPTALHAIGFRL